MSAPSSEQAFPLPGPDAAVYVISVAAELTGLHPQTLRTYDRMGLVRPGRSGGGGRRYSWRDIELLREVTELTAAGIGLEGVRRILELEDKVTALRKRVAELEEEVDVARLAARQNRSGQPKRRPEPPSQNLPVLRAARASTGQAVTVWRRNSPRS